MNELQTDPLLADVPIVDGKKLLGPIELRRKIGGGGMSAVYVGTHQRLGIDVAVKVLEPSLAKRDETFVARFQREAQLAASIQHQNLVRVYDVLEQCGLHFLVMEYVEGEDTARRVARDGPFSVIYAVQVIAEAAAGIAAAHNVGVVHRDVKPGNIMLDRGGHARVMDLGIAKAIAGRENLDLTGTHTTMGTPRYMPPEQWSAASSVTPASDVWALGATLYFLLAGKHAMTGGSVLAIQDSSLKTFPDIRKVHTSLPVQLSEIIGKCTARDPSDRFRDASELVEALGVFGTVADVDVDQVQAPRPAASDETSSYDEGDTGTWAILPQPEPPPPQVEGGTMVAPRTGQGERLDESLDRQLGRYKLVDFIAEGQTGTLYKAYDGILGRLVGLKVLHGDQTVAQKRLLRAAGVWEEVNHPHLLNVLNVHVGDETNPPWVATELIDGTDLESAVQSRNLSLQEKLRIVIQLCDAIHYLHERRVVHREIKPKNILVASKSLHVTLLDSGIARSANPGLVELTMTGIVVGDLCYMAPEQAEGRLDQRSDIFSAGAVLYGLLFGEKPHFQKLDVMRNRVLQSTYEQALRTTLLGALTKDPEDRYAHAIEFGDLLRQFDPEPLPSPKLSDIVVTLHGIRTHARWQRAFSEVASQAGLHCQLDRWCFGFYSVVRFLLPWPRRAKVTWFRETYQMEFGDRLRARHSLQRPSIVAHSFGTYILGNALLRYPYLRFDKVLLCGSILPRDFPWDSLIDSGRVQAVRNEYGSDDFWTRAVAWFVPGTGPSGLTGFTAEHDRLQQERFEFSHSEYFEKGHMRSRWVPFFKRRMKFIDPKDPDVDKSRARGTHPWATTLLYMLLLGGSAWMVVQWVS